MTPFLPGDSLLFAAGALAAHRRARRPTPDRDPADRGGDHRQRRELLDRPRRRERASSSVAQRDPRWGRWVNPDYVDRAHEFFERHGGKAIVLARFVPIVRTFVPFVAGVAEMSYPAFALYNVTGGDGLGGVCVGAGYLFGNVPIVRDNFSLVAIGIVFVSLLPMLIEYLRHRSRKPSQSSRRSNHDGTTGTGSSPFPRSVRLQPDGRSVRLQPDRPAARLQPARVLSSTHSA